MLGTVVGLFTSCTRPSTSKLIDDVHSDSSMQATRRMKQGGRLTELNADVVGLTKGNESCIFCGVSREKGFDVVYENDEFVVFRDHKPAAEQHLLVIPKRHIDSVRTLTKEDVSMVARMAEVGHNVLDDFKVPVQARKLGFHIPPYYSVKHLHLHLLVAPYRSAYLRAKYPVVRGRAGYEKGISWFVEVEQAIAILQKGGRVKISSC